MPAFSSRTLGSFRSERDLDLICLLSPTLPGGGTTAHSIAAALCPRTFFSLPESASAVLPIQSSRSRLSDTGEQVRKTSVLVHGFYAPPSQQVLAAPRSRRAGLVRLLRPASRSALHDDCRRVQKETRARNRKKIRYRAGIRQYMQTEKGGLKGGGGFLFQRKEGQGEEKQYTIFLFSNSRVSEYCPNRPNHHTRGAGPSPGGGATVGAGGGGRKPRNIVGAPHTPKMVVLNATTGIVIIINQKV